MVRYTESRRKIRSKKKIIKNGNILYNPSAKLALHLIFKASFTNIPDFFKACLS